MNRRYRAPSTAPAAAGRTLSLLLAALMAAAPAAAAQLSAHEDFEDYAPGNHPEGWQAFAGRVSVAGGKGAAGTTQSLHLAQEPRDVYREPLSEAEPPSWAERTYGPNGAVSAIRFHAAAGNLRAEDTAGVEHLTPGCKPLVWSARFRVSDNQSSDILRLDIYRGQEGRYHYTTRGCALYGSADANEPGHRHLDPEVAPGAFVSVNLTDVDFGANTFRLSLNGAPATPESFASGANQGFARARVEIGCAASRTLPGVPVHIFSIGSCPREGLAWFDELMAE